MSIRDTPYRRDSHMEHYMSDILAAPAPAAIAEESPDMTMVMNSHELSMRDLTEKLEGVQHLHGALLSTQSNSRGDRRSSSDISSIQTASSLSRPRTPQEALQGLLDRIDQHHTERDQERIRELELENEMLRRHHQHRINPELLGYQHRDHGYALVQNHGQANLRHS
ncbi:hypothetical protein BGX24_000762 [Mortierella sp. AD032]|nr:hypothetical protein BGX24_000762 [Mortierella sp. AD032]